MLPWRCLLFISLSKKIKARGTSANVPPSVFVFKAPAEPSCPWLNIDVSLQRLPHPPRACRRSTVYQYYIRTENRPQKHEKEMCASIHLSFKMEALKTAQGGFRPVLSHQRCEHCSVVFTVCMNRFFCSIGHRNSTTRHTHLCLK